MHKHQVKSAAVDDNIQAPIGRNSYHYERDGTAKSRSTMKNTKNTEELSQMMCNLLRHQSAPNVEIKTLQEIQWTTTIPCQYSKKLWSTKSMIHSKDWYDF